MTTRTEIVTIPAKEYEETIYIASDGKEFEWQSDCIRYEKQLAKDNHPLNKTKIENDRTGKQVWLYDFKEENGFTLYYLSSIDDFHALQDLLGRTYCLPEDTEEDKLFKDKDCRRIQGWTEDYCDFYKFGPGWYMVYTIDGGDWSDSYYCKNWGNYINNLETELRTYKANINSLIINKSEELGMKVNAIDLGVIFKDSGDSRDSRKETKNNG